MKKKICDYVIKKYGFENPSEMADSFVCGRAFGH